MTRIKICGITSAEDALAACEAGADAIGFVFADSPRKVSRDIVAAIVKELPSFVTTVGVFDNESIVDVQETVRYCGLHIAQLHGQEDVLYCQALGMPFLKAFRLKTQDTLNEIRSFPYSDFLVDSYQAGTAGGTGLTADWTLAAQARRLGRMVLAGGLNPDNVKTALEAVRPYAVDVSSGVEAYPGKKDKQKIKQFIKEVQTWDFQTIGVISGNTAAGSFLKR